MVRPPLLASKCPARSERYFEGSAICYMSRCRGHCATHHSHLTKPAPKQIMLIGQVCSIPRHSLELQPVAEAESVLTAAPAVLGALAAAAADLAAGAADLAAVAADLAAAAADAAAVLSRWCL